MPIPVACQGLGPIGLQIARRLITRPGISVVAGLDLDAAKAGRDLGELAGGARLGLAVTTEVPRCPDGRAGVLVNATGSRLGATAPDLISALDKGWNVLSTCEELAYPGVTGAALAAELDTKARAAGASILGAGINPGFLLDALVLVLTTVCVTVRRVEVARTVDTNQRRLPLQAKAGVGLTAGDFRARAAAGTLGHVGLRESASLVCAGLGWPVDDYTETIDPVLAPEAVSTGLGVIPEGSAIGQLQTATVRSGGEVVLRYRLQMSAGAPPRDSIDIFGEPDVHQQISAGVNGDIGTVAVLANLVPVLAAARPGLLTMADVVGAHCAQALPGGPVS
jgi:4-hydroxy-tetrahydrodipicolinate reductase